MQKRHEEKQWLQTHLEKVAKTHHIEHAAQKVRKIAEVKAKKVAEKWRLIEKKKKQKQLWNKVLAEDAALLESTEESQIAGSKCKEITSENKERQWLSKKNKEKQLGKYHRGTTIKMGNVNLCERYVSVGQDCLVYHSR